MRSTESAAVSFSSSLGRRHRLPQLGFTLSSTSGRSHGAVHDGPGGTAHHLGSGLRRPGLTPVFLLTATPLHLLDLNPPPLLPGPALPAVSFPFRRLPESVQLLLCLLVVGLQGQDPLVLAIIDSETAPLMLSGSMRSTALQSATASENISSLIPARGGGSINYETAKPLSSSMW